MCFNILFLQQWSLSCAYSPWQFNALLPVFFETLVPADSWSFCSSLQVLLDSWTALLIILFTTLSKMVLGVDGCHDLQIIQTHLAYLFIKTFRLPTEIIRGVIKNLLSNKNGGNILLSSLFPKYSQCFLQKHKFLMQTLTHKHLKKIKLSISMI